MKISEMQKQAAETAREKGFHANDHEIYSLPLSMHGEMEARLRLSWLANIYCEVSEASEAVRRGNEKNLAEELADILIRVGDMAEHCDIDLEKAVIEKMEYNRTRPLKHGGKLA